MRLNLEWFRTFKAIYETGTLTGAAQSLYISQPGVSLHLNSLEAYTGYKLFDRSAKRMTPTEKGKFLYNFILEPIDKLERGESLFHRSSKEERNTISVGMCFETFQFTLEKYISSLPFNLILKFGGCSQMLNDLEKGFLDLIISPHKGSAKNIEYKAFSKERIVLVCGGKTDISHFQKLLENNSLEEMEKWLRKQTWYNTSADTEHMKRFWMANFKHHLDFKPNYIVPNICSIIRCLNDEQGFSIIPDFLCREEVAAGKIKLVWEGETSIENTLYFANRKKTLYQQEIKQIQKILEKEI
jgi:DNA-binding transcriptional LysR family regulator